MSHISLDYDQVERQFDDADLENTAAEVHGLMCGLFSGGAVDIERRVIIEVLPDDSIVGDAQVDQCRQLLEMLYKGTEDSAKDQDFGFAPFLPDDDKSLLVRGRAVADWSQGFLYGFGLAGTVSQGQLKGDASDALNALSEISQLDVAALQASDDEEFALAEIIEFLRVAALLIRSELQAAGVIKV